MSTVTSSTNPSAGAATAATSTTKTTGLSADSAKAESERFLKLLVTQLQNQDPMNPVDNAQMTSQMAQISTVSGIEKLNTSVNGMSSSFMQMQVMQGAALVGKGVVVKSDKLAVPDSGPPTGTFQLDAAATSVKVEVFNGSDVQQDTFVLKNLTAGRHDFTWNTSTAVTPQDGMKFKITASKGDVAIGATTLLRDKVDAVNTSGTSLTLETARSGNVPYTDVVAVD